MRVTALPLAFALLLPHAAVAEQPALTVSGPWLRATPKGAAVAGGYATITNAGSQPDRLVGATLDGARAGEVHTMTTEGGVMRMRRLDDGLAVPPGVTVTLAPGGDHLMFLDPARQFKEGESVPGTLRFARAGSVAVTFAVAGIGARTAPGQDAGRGAGQGGHGQGGHGEGGHAEMRGMAMPGR